MKQNILLYHDVDRDETQSLRHSSNNYSFVSYQCSTPSDPGAHVGVPMVTETQAAQSIATERVSVSAKLKQLFKEMEVQSKVHLKEKFLSDLRKCRETHTGDALAKALHAMRRRLDDPNVLSGDVVLNMLISFREIQVRYWIIIFVCRKMLSQHYIF